MPITYTIDRDKRLVVATACGVLTDADVFAYQQAAWSGSETKGFDELVDMAAVTRVEFVSTDRLSELARLSAHMDAPAPPSKFAIVATADYHYGLGRMYQAYREMAASSAKVVRVFRRHADALEWLGVEPRPPS